MNEQHTPNVSGPKTPVTVLLTGEQKDALRSLAARFNTEVDWSDVTIGGSGLPAGWTLCQVGPIVVGVSPGGDVHS